MAHSGSLATPKRKLSSKKQLASRKRAKVQVVSAEQLPWKTISRSADTIIDEDDGILELEEVEDVEVVYEETSAGKVAKFNVISKDAEPPKPSNIAEEKSPAVGFEDFLDKSIAETFDSDELLPNWHSFQLHPRLCRALHSSQFLSPTPIQARTLPAAQEGRDIVGVAETGSGKTLAYGLPILHHLLSRARNAAQGQNKRRLSALILTPTRELALQVSSHLNACLNDPPSSDVAQTSTENPIRKGKKKGQGADARTLPTSKAPPLVSVAAIVGGMSAQKQRRVLDRGVDILVATPGRLWDIMEEDESLAAQVKSLRFLVLDEADRMIETGHFAELENILRLTLRFDGEGEEEVPDFPGKEKSKQKDVTEPKDQLQTFVFSATMSKDLQQNLKKRYKPKREGKKQAKPASTLDDLLLRLDFRDSEPIIIDLSPERGVVATLKESKIECLVADKDVYLYYFLLRHPGRSLVFLSAIDGIRRLMPLMDLLNINAYPLHSQLEQRQRLKNLDRFKSTPNSVLLATDIAARGLDIPAVDHVVHYQIPRSADAYVHRNGRTARAMRDGFSMLMCAPDERRVVRGLLSSLHRGEEEIPEIGVELYLLDKLKARVQLARQIDTAQHKLQKTNHDRKWMRDAAEAMDLELGSDFDDDPEEEENTSKRTRKSADAKAATLRAQLKQLLAQPLIAHGISTRYVTSGSRPIVDDILAGNHHETMVGLQKAGAGHSLVAAKKSKSRKPEQFEEWAGIAS